MSIQIHIRIYTYHYLTVWNFIEIICEYSFDLCSKTKSKLKTQLFNRFILVHLIFFHSSCKPSCPFVGYPILPIFLVPSFNKILYGDYSWMFMVILYLSRFKELLR